MRLPGESVHTPVVYEFGTPYAAMVSDLRRRNERRYTANGILPMLMRDADIKKAPEQWPSPLPVLPPSSSSSAPLAGLPAPSPAPLPLPHFSLIVTFEQRVYDSLLSSLTQRLSWQQRLCHVVNLHTTDNTSEATVSAALVCEWVGWLVERGEEWEMHLDESISRFEAEFGRQLLHSTWWY